MSLSKIGKGEKEKERVVLRRKYIEEKLDANLNDVPVLSGSGKRGRQEL